MKKISLVLVVLAMLLGCSSALASSLTSAINPVGHSFLYLGGGLVVVSSVLVMFDKRLD